MSDMQNTQSNNVAADADDDIVDLLNVVSASKSAGTTMSSTPAAMKNAIDSILSEDDKSSTKPFPDPSPVNYVVDPNEKLDLPEADDIDALLKNLNDSTDNTSASNSVNKDSAATSWGASDKSNTKEDDMPNVPLDDLDEFLSSNSPLERKREEEPIEKSTEFDLLLDGMADSVSEAESPSTSDESENSSAPDFDETMQESPESLPNEDEPEVASTSDEADSLPEDFADKGSDVVSSKIEKLEADIKYLSDDKLESLESRLENLEKHLHIHLEASKDDEDSSGTKISESEKQALLDGHSSLEDLQKDFLILHESLEEQREKIESIVSDLESIKSDMEKAVANAAAKVIREEISALLQSMK